MADGSADLDGFPVNEGETVELRGIGVIPTNPVVIGLVSGQ
jgi:hypothetical protein